MLRVAVPAMLLVALAPAAHGGASGGPGPCAPGPAPNALVTTTEFTGYVSLHFFGAQGTPVTFFECIRGRPLPLGTRSRAPGDIPTTLRYATLWRCGRPTRHFVATATLPDGTTGRGATSVRTASCAERFALNAPTRVAVGTTVPIRVVDRWTIGGITTRLCVTPPAGPRRCRPLAFPVVVAAATRSFRASARGRWRIELQAHGFGWHTAVSVGVRGRPARVVPTILATGDSTIEGIDSFLSDDLGSRATVDSDAHPGFAISLADGWQPIASRQMARLRPRATVVSIGANEGFSMRGSDGAMHACCDAQWTAEYARRLRATMRTYERRARAHVLWLTLPAPRAPERVPITAAVNGAILQAAQGLADVRVLRMDRLFSPDGFRATMPYRGRRVHVRSPDGIHLSIAGAAIAARVVARALRQDGGMLAGTAGTSFVASAAVTSVPSGSAASLANARQRS